MRKSIPFLSALIVFSLVCIPALADTIYVDAAASGTGDGSSWSNAHTILQDALDDAFPGDEIWVAAGTYYPTTVHDGSGDRYRSFQLKNKVGVYGGFAGNETARDQRDWEANETILSGNIGPSKDVYDNCYHVFYHPSALKLEETAVLDGVTVTGGYADGSFPHNSGGGMYNNYCSPTVTNCTFRGNYAHEGGGMWNMSIYLTMTISNCSFIENSAGSGGGILGEYVFHALLINCFFSGNTATNGGGIYNGEVSPTIVGCTFSGNTANSYGGGVYNNNGSSSPTITNCILWGDTATSNGDEIYNDNGTPVISYSDIEGSGGSGGWDTALGTDGGGNIDSDPLFADVDDFHLTSGSPCIDAGSDAAVPPDVLTDMDGDDRIDGGAVDMGADEFVDTDGDGDQDFLDTDDDNDGLSDMDENDIYNTDPLDDDSDGDGLSDGDEINTYNTDPLASDTDGDGFSDGDEVSSGTNPLVAETATDTGSNTDDTNDTATVSTDSGGGGCFITDLGPRTIPFSGFALLVIFLVFGMSGVREDRKN